MTVKTSVERLVSAALVIGRVAMGRGVFVEYQDHPWSRFEFRVEGVLPGAGFATSRRWLPANTVVSYRGDLEDLVNNEIDRLKADWEQRKHE